MTCRSHGGWGGGPRPVPGTRPPADPEGSLSYRLAAIARGLGHPRAARRFALQAVEAGEVAKTRTTVAFGHVNLARLDLDAGDTSSAAAHLDEALALLDPLADRWVLVDALETVARSQPTRTPAGATRLLDAASVHPRGHPPAGRPDRGGRRRGGPRPRPWSRVQLVARAITRPVRPRPMRRRGPWPANLPATGRGADPAASRARIGSRRSAAGP